ncbi:hypothetical protein ABFS83_12G111200 [Erythranthe nasuta]
MIGVSRFYSLLFFAAVFFFVVLYIPFMCLAIRSLPSNDASTAPAAAADHQFGFSKAPDYRNNNNGNCPPTHSSSGAAAAPCRPSLIHVAMTLDSEYLRGSMAAVHSILRHASCPEQIFFHFIAAEFDSATPPAALSQLVGSTFTSLKFKVHIFREETVVNLISTSIRSALENPLNYARNYLGELLDPCVKRVIYLDSDLILVDDISILWAIQIPEDKVIGAPEYCHANFTRYFTENFWSDPDLTRVFGSKKPCYFNTGVMVMDLDKWREGHFGKKIENWMKLQREKRIYELGSLPPFLLVFGGNVGPIDHRWNQHGLGGDNVAGSCRRMHAGPVSLMHWSGKGKPWIRLDQKKPCPLDYHWEPYDLYNPKLKVQPLQL